MGHTRPVFARYYARASLLMERGIAVHREALLRGLTGRVIDVGSGNGLTFAHYPPTVTEVLAVEPEPHLRALAQRNAAAAPVPVRVVDATAADLPVADASYDAAVASLVLCTVPDQAEALAEMYRAIRPGGQLRFFEHVRAATTGRLRVQQALDATVWPFFAGGCHCSRDTEAAITRAGFRITQLTRLHTADTHLPFPTSTQILGTAIRP